MADISVPGFGDKYKTKDYIEALMKKERIPLEREQDNLDKFKEQQSAWRSVNQKMSSLRTSSKTLYSFENPFNNKLATSSDENAITAEAGREAEYDSIKIDVLKEATADRFLSMELEKNSQVPKGKYTFEVADKAISFNWKGGKLNDFITSLNKRSSNTIKASLIGTSGNKQALLIESLKTGNDNNLIFKDDALSYALKNKIVEKSRKDTEEFGNDFEYFENPQIEDVVPENDQEGMPKFKRKSIVINEATDENGEAKPEDNRTIIPPRKGFTVPVDPKVFDVESNRIDFTFKLNEVEDVTEELNDRRTTRPDISVGNVTFADITIRNEPSDSILPPIPKIPLEQVSGGADFYVHNSDGTEIKIDTESKDIVIDPITNEKLISLAVREYPDMDSIVVRNRNTGAEISMSSYSVYDEKKNLDYTPINPISTAGDATIKYNGITINRPTNKIDDVIPHVTLNVKQPTEKTATIDISPDKDSAKDALIEFVGSYNQVIAEMNILSETKPEIIEELDYLTNDEKENAEKKLGMFQGDFSLTNGKSSLRNIVNGNYKWADEATITMLSQIGISSRASGNGGGYNAAQMRGYLEIDEKKLDSSIENDLEQIKNIFGYDKDGDLIIDSGIAFSIDKQLSSWVQSGGVIATKNSGIDKRIKDSENTIKKLESQLDTKEAQLRQKYGQMEGTLNNLNAQANTLNSFTNSNKQ